MNKKQAQDKLNDLQKEVDALKDIINGEDIFTCTTYKEVCRRLNEPQFSCPYRVIKQIEKYFNQGWKPNWKNTNEYKYFPHFSIGSGGGLVYISSGYFFLCWVGGCAFYKTSEIATFVGENFIKEYQNLRDNNY